MIIKTKRKFDEILNNIIEDTKKKVSEEYEIKIQESVSKAVANVEQDFKEVIEDLTAQMDSYASNGGVSHDDLFYKSLYSSYWGKDSKNKNSKEHITEAVSYGHSRGYITYYTTPLEREQSDEMRRYAQTIAYVRAHEDPIVGAIPDAYQRFVIGRGIQFRTDDPRIQSILEKFWRDNDMDMYSKRLVWLLVTESEFFPLYFRSKETGRVKVREIQPEEIRDIETNPNDKNIPLSYTREFVESTLYDLNKKIQSEDLKKRYYADINYFVQKKDELDGHTSEYEGKEGWQGDSKFVQYVKLMKNREVRSRVFLERILRWAEWYKNWLVDRAIRNHEISRVVWLLKLKGRKQDVWTKYMPAPAGGTTKICTDDRDWIPTNAKINADDAKEDGLALLYQVTAGSSLPIHVLVQRATESTYASLRKSENPMAMAILEMQDLIAELWLKPMFRFVIRCMAEARNPDQKIPKTIRIRKYVTEYLREAFRTTYEAYKNKEINSYEMLKAVKVLNEKFQKEFKNDNSYRGISGIYNEILMECQELNELCVKDSIRLMESNDVDLSSDTLKKAYNIFENGFSLSVEAEKSPIEIIYPDMFMDDPLNTAKILKIYKEIGIASKETLMTKAGLNPDQEKYLLKKEQEELGQEDSNEKGKDNGDKDSEPDDNDGGGDSGDDDKDAVGHGRYN